MWKYLWKYDKEDNLTSEEDITQHDREHKTDNKGEKMTYVKNITQHDG